MEAGVSFRQGGPPLLQTRASPTRGAGRKALGAANERNRSPSLSFHRTGDPEGPTPERGAHGHSVPAGSVSRLIKAMEFTRGFQHLLPSTKPLSCLQGLALL